MSFDFSALAATAVSNNNAKSKNTATPSYLLPLEEARKAVKIKDGNKTPKEDGSQALTMVIGRITIALDKIAPKATRVNATAEQVEEFTAMLVDALEQGVFDDDIIAAQAKGNPANRVANVVEALEADAQETPDGLDLEGLEEE